MFHGNTAKQHLYLFVAIFANMALQVYFKQYLVRVHGSRAFSVLCHVFTFFFFFGCGSYACFFCFVSSFFLAVLPSGHLPPLSPRRSFCFVRTQWPSGSGIRDHPLLHGLLKNPSLSAAWYVLFFLLKAAFEMLAWGTSVFAASQTCPVLVEYEHVPVALGSVVIVRKVAGKELPHQLPGKHRLKTKNFVSLWEFFFPMLLTWKFSLGCHIPRALLYGCWTTASQCARRVVVHGCWNRQKAIRWFCQPTLSLLWNLRVCCLFFFNLNIIRSYTINTVICVLYSSDYNHTFNPFTFRKKIVVFLVMYSLYYFLLILLLIFAPR